MLICDILGKMLYLERKNSVFKALNETILSYLDILALFYCAHTQLYMQVKNAHEVSVASIVKKMGGVIKFAHMMVLLIYLVIANEEA